MDVASIQLALRDPVPPVAPEIAVDFLL